MNLHNLDQKAEKKMKNILKRLAASATVANLTLASVAAAPPASNPTKNAWEVDPGGLSPAIRAKLLSVKSRQIAGDFIGARDELIAAENASRHNDTDRYFIQQTKLELAFKLQDDVLNEQAHSQLLGNPLLPVATQIQLLGNIASWATRRKDYGKAIAILEKATELEASNSIEISFLARAYFIQAEAYGGLRLGKEANLAMSNAIQMGLASDQKIPELWYRSHVNAIYVAKEAGIGTASARLIAAYPSNENWEFIVRASEPLIRADLDRDRIMEIFRLAKTGDKAGASLIFKQLNRETDDEFRQFWLMYMAQNDPTKN